MRTMGVVLLMVACDAGPDWDVSPRPATYQAPPGANQLTLTGPSVVQSGETYTWTVRGPDLTPGVVVDLGWGGQQTPGSCPYARLVGGWLCLDIGNPVRRFSSSTVQLDPSTGGGVASFTATAPFTPRTEVFLQGLSIDGLDSATSTVLPISIVSPPPCPGSSATIATQADADAYAGCTTLFNMLVQNGSDVARLDFPVLTSVTHDIWISNQSSLERISLPALQTAGAIRVRDNPSLTSFDASALEQTVGTFSVQSQSGPGLEFRRNDGLTNLYFPELVSTVGEFYLENNAGLETLDLPAFEESFVFQSGIGDGLTVLLSPLLQRLSAPLLTRVGDLAVQNNGTFTELAFPALEEVRGFVGIRNNSELVTADFPLLTSTGSHFLFDLHPAAVSVSAPSLSSVGSDLLFRENPLMSTVDVSGVTSIGAQVLINNNASWCVPAVPDWYALAPGVVSITGNACNP